MLHDEHGGRLRHDQRVQHPERPHYPAPLPALQTGRADLRVIVPELPGQPTLHPMTKGRHSS